MNWKPDAGDGRGAADRSAWLVSKASRKFRKPADAHPGGDGRGLTHVASETIQGYRVVRSFGGEAYESAAVRASASSGQHRKQLRMLKMVRNARFTFSVLVHLTVYSADGRACCFTVLAVRGDASCRRSWWRTSPPPVCCRVPIRQLLGGVSARHPARRGRRPTASSSSSTKRRSPTSGTGGARPASPAASRSQWPGLRLPGRGRQTCAGGHRLQARHRSRGSWSRWSARSGSGKSTLAKPDPALLRARARAGSCWSMAWRYADFTAAPTCVTAHRARHPAGDAVQRHGGRTTSPTATLAGAIARRPSRPAAEAAYAREFIDRPAAGLRHRDR
jgi:subfamily B ATP-binding cassette protein MsbA